VFAHDSLIIIYQILDSMIATALQYIEIDTRNGDGGVGLSLHEDIPRN